VAGYFVTHGFAALSLGVSIGPIGDVVGHDLALAALLGGLAALFGILIMRGVALCETVLAKTGLWPPLRPALGGPRSRPARAGDAAGDVVRAWRAALFPA
jgi:CIC family chloride channel protein